MNHTTFFSSFYKSKIFKGLSCQSSETIVGPLLKWGTWAGSRCKCITLPQVRNLSLCTRDSLDDFTPALQKAIHTNDYDGPFIGWKIESIIFQYSIIHFFRWAWIPLWKGKKWLMLLDFAWGGEDYLTFLLWCLLDNQLRWRNWENDLIIECLVISIYGQH